MNNKKWDALMLKAYNRKEYLIRDGITNQERYRDVNPKILWVLKEPNLGGKQRAKWSHRDFHKDGVADYTEWRNTYQPIIKVVYGILNNCFAHGKLPEITDDATIEEMNVLEYIAIINIDKRGGAPQSEQSKINNVYVALKEFLLQQIDAINPDIIINSSRVWNLFTDLVPKENRKKLGVQNLSYGKTEEGKFVIHYYHPNQRTVKEWQYCNNILQVIKKRYE